MPYSGSFVNNQFVHGAITGNSYNLISQISMSEILPELLDAGLGLL
jgi:hypothetical protein